MFNFFNNFGYNTKSERIKEIKNVQQILKFHPVVISHSHCWKWNINTAADTLIGDVPASLYSISDVSLAVVSFAVEMLPGMVSLHLLSSYPYSGKRPATTGMGTDLWIFLGRLITLLGLLSYSLLPTHHHHHYWHDTPDEMILLPRNGVNDYVDDVCADPDSLIKEKLKARILGEAVELNDVEMKEWDEYFLEIRLQYFRNV